MIHSANTVSLIVHTFYLDTIYSLPFHQSCRLNHIEILYRIPIPWVYIVHYHISILEYHLLDIFSPVRKLSLKENKYLKEAFYNLATSTGFGHFLYLLTLCWSQTSNYIAKLSSWIIWKGELEWEKRNSIEHIVWYVCIDTLLNICLTTNCFYLTRVAQKGM